MPLNTIDISHTRIGDLTPLRGMALERVNLNGTRISSLAPLEGSKPGYFDCVDCPLTSLAPFEHEPPALFRFDSPTLDQASVERVLQNWTREDRHTNVTEARALNALRTRDTAGLRRLATTWDGHDYLYVPRFMVFDTALAESRATGAHLVTITSAREQQLVLSLVPPGESAWLGLVPGDTGEQWCTGEAIAYEDLETFGTMSTPKRKYLYHAYEKVPTWVVANNTQTLSHLLLEWEGEESLSR
jgi:hypothetical protein